MRLPAALAAGLLAASAAVADTIVVVPGEGDPIQEAFDAAQTGDVIVITAGTYTGGALLAGGADITIRGRGAVEILGMEGDPFVLGFEDVEGLRVRGLSLRGGSGDGLSTQSCGDVEISRCTLESISGIGLLDRGSVGYAASRCRISGASTAGIGLSAYGGGGGFGDVVTDGIVVTGCTVETSSGPGIAFRGTGARIAGNRISGTGDRGITSYGDASCDGAVISGNRVTGHVYGIEAIAPGWTVARNRIEGAGEGIQAGGADVLLSGNRVLDCEYYGIYVYSLSATVIRNRASGNGEADFASAYAEEDTVLAGNRFGTVLFGLDL